MKWLKLGQIYHVSSHYPETISHASNPLAVHLGGDIFRIFYSGRNKDNKSSISFVDIDILKKQIVYDPKKAIFRFGKPDSFYSHGVSIGNLYEEKGHKYILFMGWQIRNNEHWRGDIGKLELIDNKKLKLCSETPFMTIDAEDPISLSYPWVVYTERGYKMWYGSTKNWTSENKEMIHVLKYATFTEGGGIEKKGIAIPYKLGVAQAFSRPTVIIDKEGYHMWYSYRDGMGTKYRIGYSKSSDGIAWENKLDEVGISVSETGWDSDMICYPFIFDHDGERYMLYNGNDYGKMGFGLAKLEL
jgi:hypothetical protein